MRLCKRIKGMTGNAIKPSVALCDVDVRITSDNHGMSLSLSQGDNMILVPLEPIKDDLLRAFKEQKKGFRS